MARQTTEVRTTVRVEEEKVCDLQAWRQRRHDALLDDAQELMMEGHEEAALQLAFDALRVERSSYPATALAGTLLGLVGDAETAALYLREAVRLRPDLADAYYELGATLLDLDRPQEALEWLDQGVERLSERDSDLRDFLFAGRAEALITLGRVDEAEAMLADARLLCEDPMRLRNAVESLIGEVRARPVLRLV